MSQDHMHLLTDNILKVNIYSHLYYTKMLNEYKFQHTRNADKVKEKELNTCIIT